MTEKDKKLKTNQMMKVEIPNFGIIEIGHKTEMGKVSQVIDIGNAVRKAKGLEFILLDKILRRQDFWEFVIALDTLRFKSINSSESEVLEKHLFSDTLSENESENRVAIYSDYSELKRYKTVKGEVQYSELMKKFPNLIKSRRGRNGGTWAELYILLKIASMLDKDLEVAIYDVFIKSQILTHRDNGGESFKKLNIAIDKYIPSESGNSEGRFIMIAKMLRKKLEITSTKGYNQKEHNSQIQQKRDEIEKNLIFALESKIVTSYEKLKVIITNLEINL